jgi:hypothetical protein
MALGDSKQRTYDFEGADPRRFDECIAASQPTTFDAKGENRRSVGTDIPLFVDAGRRVPARALCERDGRGIYKAEFAAA